MATLPKYEIVLLESSQAQKHVSVNEGFRRTTALTQITVIDRDLTAPPGSPSDLDAYIPTATATGDWTGAEDDLAIWFSDGAGGGEWVIVTPWEGAQVWVQDENQWIYWNGSAWTNLPFSAPSFSGARVQLTAAETISNSTNTVIPWDTDSTGEAFDVGGYWAAGNPTRLTAPATAYYLVTGSIATESFNASHVLQLWISKNGAAKFGHTAVSNLSSTSSLGSKLLNVSTILQLNVNDYVELGFFINSGASRDLLATDATHFAITKLGD